MENVKLDLAVVVPVYNAEKYLIDTLSSLAKQSIFSQLEIILINDGSIDNSEQICLEFKSKNSNVRVYSQKNTGVSGARNLGIQIASSPYITFLDADDTIEPYLYEEILNLITMYDADIAVVNFDMIHPNLSVKEHRGYSFKIWNKTEQALESFFAGYIGNNVVDKVFKTRIAKKIEFPMNYKVGEDMYFVYRAVTEANVIVMDTSICGYHYVIRDNSAMTSSFSSKYFDTIALSLVMLEECKNEETIYEYAQAHLIHEICKVLEYMYRKNAGNIYKKSKKKLRCFLHNYRLTKAKKYLSSRQFYGFCLMRFSPVLYMFIHRILKIG